MRRFAIALALLLLGSAAYAGGMLKPGDAFPAWTLQDQNGTTVSSTDFSGKTYLLYFYPKAMTPGCTKEGCVLRDNFAAFEKDGVQVLGVSFDTPKENAEFAAKYKFPFRLLSDATHNLAVEVGAAESPSQKWARRISYLVGTDGKVLEAYDHVNPSEHAGQVLTDLQKLGTAAGSK